MINPFPSCEDFDDRAHQLYDAGEYDRALEVLKQGLVSHPDAAVLHVALGYVRIAREEWAWGRRSFQAAIDLDEEHEDGWVGLGEVLLKLGDHAAALRCFARVADLGLENDLEIGLAVGRALYREGCFADARRRFTTLALAHPGSAEPVAARGYTLHAMGDDAGARRDLRRALRMDAELHEARIYLAHLLYDRGDLATALSELEQVPPAEHWDPLSLWRFLELKRTVAGCSDEHPPLAPWRDRLRELDREPDAIDHLLAEVEAAFDAAEDCPPSLTTGSGGARTEIRAHRIRTPDGAVFTGSWHDIVVSMRDAASGPHETVEAFMRRSALQVRETTGSDLPYHSAEAFVRASERIGLLRIEA
jgi:Flp pilus assembly protein TadD